MASLNSAECAPRLPARGGRCGIHRNGRSHSSSARGRFRRESRGHRRRLDRGCSGGRARTAALNFQIVAISRNVVVYGRATLL